MKHDDVKLVLSSSADLFLPCGWRELSSTVQSDKHTFEVVFPLVNAAQPTEPRKSELDSILAGAS